MAANASKLALLLEQGLFGDEVASPDEGFVDPKATELELCVAGVDLTIHQSPGILSSNRAKGTTGAEWLAMPDNILFLNAFIDGQTTVLELGAGIAGIVALTVAPRVERYIATDQEYLLKPLQKNIEDNYGTVSMKARNKARSNRPHGSKSESKDILPGAGHNIDVISLDWELDALDEPKRLFSEGHRFVIACDCIYNDALIAPFVDICAAASKQSPNEQRAEPAVCLIAQQLRSPEVFEGWLVAMMKQFHVWRLPDEQLTKQLRGGSGFAVHLAIRRE